MPPGSSTIAFTGGRVVTMNGDEVIEDGVVARRGQPHQGRRPEGRGLGPRGGEDVRRRGKTVLPGFVDAHYHGSFGADGVLPQQNWHSDASLAFGVTTVHDPSNDTERGLLGRRARARRALPRPAHLLDRHDPLRRRRRLQGRDRLDRRRARAPAPPEGRGRDLGQELPAAAPRAAPADPRGRARDRHHGRARGRIALRDEHEHGRGRAHDDRAHDPRRPTSTRTSRRSGLRGRSATRRRCSSPTAGSSGRSTGTRRPTSGRTRASRSSSRRSSSTRARAGARWRPTTSGTTSTRRGSPRSSTRTASPSTPAPTASARGSASTGRSGCSRREA